ncbi:hypothetical protein LEP1GSC082_4397 [Leptospira kirschneri str. H2]|uniref:Uncharacterized protein n=1 Tax=Leptospira kirschneri serovar Bulgarica str. Nikolaevo TaxID=1240687 RepID=M6FCI9_9LEPT|nr:hypothetical protein LEP1GSC082_4397 [Leptospira kirschneri str. H2]EMK24777.1 hypothetical protein LEP1GSC008_1941 [Leptospira kirschneri serovar Bulgarica str. Nikolaevo]
MIFHDSYTFLLIDRSFLQTDFLKKKIGTARIPVGSIFLIFQKFVTIEIRKNYKLQKFDLLFKDDPALLSGCHLFSSNYNLGRVLYF